METVTINITRASVLADMKVKSHAEVASAEDEMLRYLSELGGEKAQEAQQGITDAAVEVSAVLRPFLSGFTGAETATDTYDTTATISYQLSVTARKSPGLADAMTKAVHAYIVDSALDKFYTSVSRQDLAERHRAKLPAELTAISSLLHHRTAPTYSAPSQN